MVKALDDKDFKVLEVLKDHANYPTRKIAKKTLLPITTVHNRIQKLKKEKVIKKFTVEIDHHRVGKGLLVYLLIDANLPLLHQKKKTLNDLSKTIRKFHFVETVDVVAGESDLIIRARFKDVLEFNHALQRKIQQTEGVLETRELIAIQSE